MGVPSLFCRWRADSAMSPAGGIVPFAKQDRVTARNGMEWKYATADYSCSQDSRSRARRTELERRLEFAAAAAAAINKCLDTLVLGANNDVPAATASTCVVIRIQLCACVPHRRWRPLRVTSVGGALSPGVAT